MNAKLYKTEKENYVLVDTTKGTYDDGYMLGTSRESQYNKLSIKNCEAIANGYDLDELAKSEAIKISETEVRDEKLERIYKRGFQKALEILGDKKFSEKDLRTAYGVGYLMKINPSEVYHETLNGLVQLLQKNEWGVEVVEECLDKNCDGINRKGECITTGKPKLDEEGCLILKRVK